MQMIPLLEDELYTVDADASDSIEMVDPNESLTRSLATLALALPLPLSLALPFASFVVPFLPSTDVSDLFPLSLAAALPLPRETRPRPWPPITASLPERASDGDDDDDEDTDDVTESDDSGDESEASIVDSDETDPDDESDQRNQGGGGH